MQCNRFRAFSFLVLLSSLHVLFCCIYFKSFKFKLATLSGVETGRTFDVHKLSARLLPCNASVSSLNFLYSPADASERRDADVVKSSGDVSADLPHPPADVPERHRADVVEKPRDIGTNTSGDVTSSPPAAAAAPLKGPRRRTFDEGSCGSRHAVMPRANVTAPWGGRHTEANVTQLCPLMPPNLRGPLATLKTAPNFTDIVKQNPGLEPGGHYQPVECRARHRVAIIVSYRDREEHLRVLLHNLHPILKRQQLDYFILVVELAKPTVFNRGLLLNVGAVEAMGLWDVQCFIFHDVDLIPENDLNLYTCPDMPRHMSAAVDKFKYRLPFKNIFGGVVAIRSDHFCKINGFSNEYFGWGGEDDDLYKRVIGSGLNVTRYSLKVARYWMFRHKIDKGNEINKKRFYLLKRWKDRWAKDGLNSLQYKLEDAEFREGYTWMLVSVNDGKRTRVIGKRKALPRDSRRAKH